ncbi:NADH dehydrogenase [ubiquinone] 1 subunit C2 [Nilaparvata lugens]|uniref:NADH dehydrogenase [ubiquinone] 1 subunit C2 n=1 Tax=Nilaparvata lugens TaxID=108931 RepID=UPI000B9948AD|nr:NADH dehydrogenase [ubiquinone] 1 subunit C2 [Nilaparvata lugens]
MAAIEDPRTLLNSDGSTYSLFDKVMGPSILGFCTGSLSVYYDYSKNKPIQAGALKHVALLVAGAYAGHLLAERRNAHNRDRDAAYRHYIELHPEDFPAPKRVLIKDMMKKWSPSR